MEKDEKMLESLYKTRKERKPPAARDAEIVRQNLFACQSSCLPSDAPCQVSNLSRQADLKSRHKLMSDKLNELRVDAAEKDRELQLMNQRLASHTAKLKGLQDVKEARKSHLIQKNPGLREAMEWVESNRHRFKGEVFGPLGLEVTVHQPEHAQYLEQHCSQRLWGVRSPAAAPASAGSCFVSTRPHAMG